MGLKGQSTFIETKEEKIKFVSISKAKADMADMRTLVIVGSSQTRIIHQNNREWMYTPRHYPGKDSQ